MLIHKDGKTNLEHMDTTTDRACRWIKDKNPTKVLMNSPFERKFKCKTIVTNVLNHVPRGTQCAFILTDKKLEKDKMHKLLHNHTLHTIVKLPEKLFDEGVSTSVFVFESGVPQDSRKIFACYMEDDGLETVKNQGRHDIRGNWADIKDYWLNVVHTKVDEKYNTHQWLNPSKHLSYQMPQKPFEIFEEDFKKPFRKCRDAGYTRSFGSMCKQLKKLKGYEDAKVKKRYFKSNFTKLKAHYPGEFVEVDVKYVPLECIGFSSNYDRYYQITAIDLYSRKRVLSL